MQLVTINVEIISKHEKNNFESDFFICRPAFYLASPNSVAKNFAMRVSNYLKSRSKILPFALILLSALFCSKSAWAYPEFIGYKYASCLTCHYNGNGGGPLNDYGRALWSTEIAGRMFAGDKTAEQLGESSGFLGSTKLPWWIRPGIKARELYFVSQPGQKAQTSKSIVMQAEGNVALLFNQRESFAFIGSYGYIPTPKALENTPSQKNGISREHYFRIQATKSLWVYAGFMDKIYGMHIVDHTAFSRAMTGFAQNDQAHSLIFQYIQPKWEFSFDGFAGNLYQNKNLRQQGASFMTEYEVGENWRLGLSGVNSKNSYVKNQRYALHSRNGLGEGSAILFEVGLINNDPVIANSSTQKNQGYYVYSEAIQRITRGYHFFLTGQSYKNNLSSGNSDSLIAGAGLLMFPMARVEFRVEVLDGRTMSYDTTADDTWTALAQLHISL